MYAIRSYYALKIYLRQISENQLLSPDEQTDLTEMIGNYSSEFRKRVYMFGFIFPEHLKLLSP